MTILTKIKNNESKFSKLLFGGHLGPFSGFSIEEEGYYLLYPYQALALQELGIEVEFYKSNTSLYREFPCVPGGTKVEKTELKPKVNNPKEFEKYLENLREILE